MKIKMAHYVYKMLDEQGAALYIGVTGNLHQRMGAHSCKGGKACSGGISAFMEASNFVYGEFTSREEAYLVESILIRNEQPKYNAAGKSGGEYGFSISGIEWVEFKPLIEYRGLQADGSVEKFGFKFESQESYDYWLIFLSELGVDKVKAGAEITIPRETMGDTLYAMPVYTKPLVYCSESVFKSHRYTVVSDNSGDRLRELQTKMKAAMDRCEESSFLTMVAISNGTMAHDIKLEILENCPIENLVVGVAESSSMTCDSFQPDLKALIDDFDYDETVNKYLVDTIDDLSV